MTISERIAAARRERRVLARVSRAAWRLDQAERERTWALVSARAEGISIRALATAAARFLDPATGAGLGGLAGRAIPARRDQPTARLHRQPVPATLTAPRAATPPGQFRKLDAVAVLTDPLLPGTRQADGECLS